MTEEVTIPQKVAENAEFWSEEHMTSVTWVSGPQSAIVHASWSSNQDSQTETRII